MKIAILGTKGIPGHNGVEVVVDSLVPHLSSMGHDITVYGYDSYTQPADSDNCVRIRTVPGSSRKNLEMISHMWNASVDSRRRNFDIVHIHNTDPCLLAWLPKARYGIISTSHGQAYIRKKWGITARTMSKAAERFFIYLPDIITSVSKPLADFYEKKYKKKVFFIPNGIKCMEAPDKTFLKRWNLEPEKYLFCSAGRIERTKGIHTLLEAYNKLKIDLPLVIAGGGNGTDHQYFRELKHKKPNGVIFTGFLTGDDLFSLYAHTGVFVFPSEYEAMSMALLEGLSFGVPTIYSNIPENTAVTNGLGYAFEVSNAVSLVKQLHYVLKHYNEALTVGGKAKKYIKKNYDWKNIAKQYNEIYLKLSGKEREQNNFHK